MFPDDHGHENAIPGGVAFPAADHGARIGDVGVAFAVHLGIAGPGPVPVSLEPEVQPGGAFGWLTNPEKYVDWPSTHSEPLPAVAVRRRFADVRPHARRMVSEAEPFVVAHLDLLAADPDAAADGRGLVTPVPQFVA
ncbi:hypothetical protein [Amycolatopsis ultiminotia]|uniref:hypothetical protein n=1 Tax=Amycolatopsis ultiminotia TaxID=543629 RepID=UPI0031E58C14